MARAVADPLFIELPLLADVVRIRLRRVGRLAGRTRMTHEDHIAAALKRREQIASGERAALRRRIRKRRRSGEQGR